MKKSYGDIIKSLLKNNKEDNKQIIPDNSVTEQQTILKPFAVLQQNQIEEFARGLLANCYSLYDLVYAKTGVKSFTARTDKALRYKSAIDLKEYTYLAGLEALLSGIYYYKKIAFEFLDYGEGTIFDEKQCSVRYLKEQSPFKKQSAQGNKNRENYTIQFFYESPLGNFLIKQNSVNNKIYEVYTSEDISETLYNRLVTALEKSLDVNLTELEDVYNSSSIQIDNNNLSQLDGIKQKVLNGGK